jgi:ribonuclease P protein component
MNSTPTIKQNSEFRRVYQHGKSTANRNLVLYYRKNQMEHTRVGITVSKKVGKSVVRNKVKRRIKESLREMKDLLPEGYDLVWIARVSCKEADYRTLNKAVKHLLSKTFNSKANQKQ